jgi:glycosyltransferase involved in cell wall biosynthesis
MVSITACLIVRNEERFLSECLRSLSAACEKIIILDTGSSDRTVDIASSFTSHLQHVRFNGDFSEVRNFALEQVRSDWVLFLDADEIGQVDQMATLPRLLASLQKTSLGIDCCASTSFRREESRRDEDSSSFAIDRAYAIEVEYTRASPKQFSTWAGESRMLR